MTIQNIQAAIDWAKARLGEPSTYVAIAVLFGYFHVPISASQIPVDGEFVRQILIGVSGLMGVVLSEKGVTAAPSSSVLLDRTLVTAN